MCDVIRITAMIHTLNALLSTHPITNVNRGTLLITTPTTVWFYIPLEVGEGSHHLILGGGVAMATSKPENPDTDDARKNLDFSVYGLFDPAPSLADRWPLVCLLSVTLLSCQNAQADSCVIIFDSEHTCVSLGAPNLK